MPRYLRLLQINLGRRKAAHDMAFMTAAEKQIDIIVTSEPNKKIIKGRGWIADQSGDVAIYLRNNCLTIYRIKKGKGMLSIDLEIGRIICCYISPNSTVQHFEQFMDTICEDIKTIGGGTILMGDFNAKSPTWGAPATDVRGEIFIESTARKNVVVLNNGKPTFERGTSKSYIDITAATERLSRKITGWDVMEEETLSDHHYIYFQIQSKENKHRILNGGRKEISETNFREVIAEMRDCIISQEDEGTTSIEKCIKMYKNAHDLCLREQNDQHREKPYWWNEEIAAAKRNMNTARRKLIKAGRRGQENLEEMRENIKELRKRN